MAPIMARLARKTPAIPSELIPTPTSSAATPIVTVADWPGSIWTGLAQECAAAGATAMGSRNATMSRMRRTVVTAAIAVGWLLTGASPAAAHSVSGAGASNYETRLEGVAPRIDGIEMKVVEDGSRFELTNTTAEDVVVLGYQEEPYLRVGPAVSSRTGDRRRPISTPAARATRPCRALQTPKPHRNGRRPPGRRLFGGTTIAFTGWATRSRRRSGGHPIAGRS